MKLKYLIIIVLTSAIQTLQAVVILVHGTGAYHQKWYRPGSSFYHTLTTQARKKNLHVVSFGWSGNLGTQAKIEAAEVLCHLILSYPAEEAKILIGHSHGGNVITIASKLLQRAQEYIRGEQVLNATTKNLNGATLRLLETASLRVANNLSALFATTTRVFVRKTYITAAYLLATPIDTTLYGPDMQTIEHLYVLSSQADYVQPVLGLYTRFYPDHPRIYNLWIRLGNRDSQNAYSPGHNYVCDKRIARWLLDLPVLVTNTNYSTITFLAQGKPIIETMTKTMKVQDDALPIDQEQSDIRVNLQADSDEQS